VNEYNLLTWREINVNLLLGKGWVPSREIVPWLCCTSLFITRIGIGKTIHDTSRRRMEKWKLWSFWHRFIGENAGHR
jgi:hypothetical protein